MRHVLAVRLDNEGDVLLMGPAVRALAAGADRVTLLAGPRGESAARLLPGVDEVLVHRAPWIDPEPPPVERAATMALVDRVAALDIDQAVVFTSYHQNALPTALLLRMAGVPVISAISEDYPGALLDVRHHVDDGIHEVERALSLVATLGYALPPGDSGQLAVRAPLPDTSALTGSAPYVVVHPGASVPARAWAPGRHEALVARLAATGRRVVVTGAPAERALTAAVAGPVALDLGGRTTFAELAGVLAGADAVVVGNTGPAHLAAAVGTPIVSLFAPTVPAVRWRPWAVPHIVLNTPVPCAGCRASVCPVAGHPCLDEVDVESAAAAVAQLAPDREGVRA